MIIDGLLNVSRSQVVTANGGSTDVIDLGATQQPIGPGRDLWLICFIKAVSGTAPTIAVALQTDDNASMSSPNTLVTSQTFTSPPVGQRIALAVPLTNERFIRAYFTVGGTSPSFTVDAMISDENPQSWSAFPDGI